MSHLLYDNDDLVREMTINHMLAGRTVYQIWQMAPTEKKHSLKVLEYFVLPDHAQILSLGCGIGGMERHWKHARPDFQFTLVNPSRAQLDFCVCPGIKHCIQAEHYRTLRPFDAVVMAYMLGHTDQEVALKAGMLASKGLVIVLDVFDTSEEFNARLLYNTVPSELMLDNGFVKQMVPIWGLDYWLETDPAHNEILTSRPGFWIKDMRHD